MSMNTYKFNFRFTRPDENDAHLYEVGYIVVANTREQAENELRQVFHYLTIQHVELFSTSEDNQ
jgi:hypothetical protein